MKLLIVELSTLTIRIPLGSKYLPQDPVLRSSLNVAQLAILSLLLLLLLLVYQDKQN